MSTDCKFWQRCSAPICPLDPQVDKRKHLPGEPICRLLCEVVKPDSLSAFVAAGIGEWIHAEVSAAVLPLSERWGRIRQGLDRAAKTGSVLTPSFGRTSDA